MIWCVLFGEIQNVQGIAVRAPVFCADCLVGVQHHPAIDTVRRWPPRGLAGKPLAGFCTTPSRRITVVYGVIVYAIRFKTPSLHR